MKYRGLKEEEDLQNAVEQEIICNEEYCPWWQKHISSPNNPICEGSYCEEAWDNFCNKHDKEYES